jgi:hypothetical protein
MFTQTPQQVVVLTDTLATTPAGSPHLFVTKCAVVPHLDMVVAHTGVAQVGHRWSHQLQTAMLARDIDLLDRHVPARLRSIAAELASEFGDPGMTSTVYHLGFSAAQEAYVGYVYRSEADCASEVMEPGFRVKPQPVGQVTAPKDLDGTVALGRQLRGEQNGRPADERVHIGGELVVTMLTNRLIQVAKVHRFEDFERQWTIMNAALGGSGLPAAPPAAR